MILAELEVFHSRPIAPTRRVALGRANLPVEPPPGFGGILLGAIVARNVPMLDEDLVDDLLTLMKHLERGARVSQPRLRYRFQVDKVGLQMSSHRLHGRGEELWFEFDDSKGDPNQQLLGAVYSAGRLDPSARKPVMGAMRRAIGWAGDVGPDLIATLAGFGRGSGMGEMAGMALANPVGWALGVLGLTEEPSKTTIQRRFREELRSAHPDHGGGRDDAAKRIAELTQARKILLGA